MSGGPLPPGSTIGILGSGQLGRMTALAAARLGLRCHFYSPDADSPASQVAVATVAAYDDAAALDAFAAAVDVVTFEFENVPLATAERLARRVPVRPGPRLLEIAQDRLAEKEFANRAGARTTAYAAVDGTGDLAAAIARVGLPAILKTRRLGYDGKGQARIESADRAPAAWIALGGVPCILEAVVPFVAEVSVIVTRGLDGAVACFETAENEHESHILRTTRVPARVGPDVDATARAVAEDLARAVDLVGVLAVEMFVTADQRVLVNELAPRPHNSGHWTIDAAVTSQFEQQARAVCGWPLGSTARLSEVEMTNLLGDEASRWETLAAEPGARLHLYGKGTARPGRKMGHVTRLG